MFIFIFKYDFFLALVSEDSVTCPIYVRNRYNVHILFGVSKI